MIEPKIFTLFLSLVFQFIAKYVRRILKISFYQFLWNYFEQLKAQKQN